MNGERFNKSSKLPPHKPCFALFDGFRASRPGYFESILDLVRVVEVNNGNGKALAVCRWGRSTRWPLDTFEGEWEVLYLNLESATNDTLG